MADNVAVTAGSGTSVATDDIGGVHYQITKTAMGALDSQTLLQKVTVSGSAASTTDTTIASSSAVLYGVACFSTAATLGKVQILDSTSGSTGTTVTGFYLSTGAGAVRSQTLWFGPQGLKLTSGIRIVRPDTTKTTVTAYFISPA